MCSPHGSPSNISADQTVRLVVLNVVLIGWTDGAAIDFVWRSCAMIDWRWVSSSRFGLIPKFWLESIEFVSCVCTSFSNLAKWNACEPFCCGVEFRVAQIMQSITKLRKELGTNGFKRLPDTSQLNCLCSLDAMRASSMKKKWKKSLKYLVDNFSDFIAFRLMCQLQRSSWYVRRFVWNALLVGCDFFVVDLLF